MLQNATLLRTSAPWPPNISDEHVSCAAPATENASLQILFKCPKPWSQACHPFWTCDKTLTFSSLVTRCTIPCACHAKRHLTAKSAPSPSVFYTFDFEMCFAPQLRALFRHLNFQKSSEHKVFLAFSLANVLRATTACTFSASQLPKVLRMWGAFSFFTCKCARAIFNLLSGQLAPHPPL